MKLYSMVIIGGTVSFLIAIEVIGFLSKRYIKESHVLLDYIYGTTLIFFLFIQPSMMLDSLEYLRIREVNGVKYCYKNTFIKIDSDFYNNEVLPLNVTIIVLSALVFPLVLTKVLLKAKLRKNLNKVSFQRKIGVLYLEYKKKNFYWELIIILVVKSLIFFKFCLIFPYFYRKL